MTTVPVEGSMANEIEKENRNEEGKEDYESECCSLTLFTGLFVGLHL